MPTAYERRLLAAADLVLSADAQVHERRFASADLGVTADLKPHQLDGVAWLIRRYHLGVNVVLGDEMGLGKTLQAISLLSYLKIQSNAPAGPFLVLCPLSVTGGWFSEFGKFCPTLTVIQYVGDKAHRRDLRRMMYEHVQKSSASSDSNVLYNVLEQHFIMPRCLLLTGTPIQNNLSELWALMHFCMPSIFGPLDEFLSTFKEAGNSLAGGEANKANRQFKFLKHILRAFMLRRTKALLIESGILALPPLTELTVLDSMLQDNHFPHFLHYCPH